MLSAIVDDSRGFLDDPEAEKERTGSAGTESEGAKPVTSVAALPGLDEGAQNSGRSTSKPRSGTDQDRGKYTRLADHDVDKVRSTVKQLVRDWSADGQEERDAAYGPILEALELCFASVAPAMRRQQRILVPGAGLGRLAFEVAWRGFSCQGNEFR